MAERTHPPRFHRSAEPDEDVDRIEARLSTPQLQPEIEHDLPPSSLTDQPHTLRRLSGVLREHTLMQLQQTIGNHAVQRAVDRSRFTAAPTDDLALRIRAASTGGRPMDVSARERLEASLDADLSGVKIHTDDEADRLSRSIDANAFATEQHIFFREGQYQPEAVGGLHLLAHEATHTLQTAVTSDNTTAEEMAISDPSDYSERIAEQMANTVVASELLATHNLVTKAETMPRNWSHISIQRQAQEDEEKKKWIDSSLGSVSNGPLQGWGASIGALEGEDWRLKLGGPLGGGWQAGGTVGSQGWNVGAGGPLGNWNLQGNVGSQGWNVGASGPLGGGWNAQGSAGSQGVNFGLGGPLPLSTEIGGVQIGPPSLAGMAGSQGASIGMSLPVGGATTNLGIGTQGVQGGLSLPLAENWNLGANAGYNWDQSYWINGAVTGRF